jgi:probable rRNA maturation factor
MSSQQSALLFQVDTPGLSRRALRAFLKRLEQEVGQGRGFCCLIASDAELQRLNREFRKRDYATDVLSFPSEKHGSQANVGQTLSSANSGEIAISYDAAQRQSAEYGHSVEQEIKILMLHGLLHLLGMDHETDHGRMLTAERNWRIRLGLPAGLIERVGA